MSLALLSDCNLCCQNTEQITSSFANSNCDSRTITYRVRTLWMEQLAFIVQWSCEHITPGNLMLPILRNQDGRVDELGD